MAATASVVNGTAGARNAQFNRAAGLVVLTDRLPGAGCGVTDHGYFESLLEQIPQVRLPADVGEHAAQHHLGDPSLAKDHQVVGLWTTHAVRTGDDRGRVLDERPQLVKPVITRTGEAGQVERRPVRANVLARSSSVSS